MRTTLGEGVQIIERWLQLHADDPTLRVDDKPLDHLLQYITLSGRCVFRITVCDLRNDRQRGIQVIDHVALFLVDQVNRGGDALAFVLVFTRQLLENLRAHPMFGESAPQIQFFFLQLLDCALQFFDLAAAIAGEAPHIRQICLTDVGDQRRIDLNGTEMRRNLLIDFPAQIVLIAGVDAVVGDTTPRTVGVGRAAPQLPHLAVSLIEIEHPLQQIKMPLVR